MIKELKPENYTDFEELKEDIKIIHEELFPHATLGTQCAKFEEEAEELQIAKTEEEIKEEYADLFIVACGIGRWCPELADCLILHLINRLTCVEHKIELMEVICRKMNKNQERDWGEMSDGYYKHQVHNLH